MCALILNYLDLGGYAPLSLVEGNLFILLLLVKESVLSYLEQGHVLKSVGVGLGPRASCPQWTIFMRARCPRSQRVLC